MRRLLFGTLCVLFTALLNINFTPAAGGYSAAGVQGTATPTPDVDWIDIGGNLDFYYYFAPVEGATYILGEVRNNNPEAVPSPFISLTLLDDAGNIIGAQGLIEWYPIVEPGKTTPYQVVLDWSIVPGSWQSETVETSQRHGPATCSTGLELRDVVELEKTPGRLHISAKVYNGGTIPLDGVMVSAAVYRTDGIYAGVIDDVLNAAIPPGKTGSFSLFGLRVPGLELPNSSPDYTYRMFVTNTTRGSTYC